MSGPKRIGRTAWSGRTWRSTKISAEPEVRVAFVASTLAVGGAEALLCSLVLHLRGHGVEPAVVALNHRGRFYDVLRTNGVTTSFSAMSSRYDVRGAWRAYASIREAQPDVIVTQGVDAAVIGRCAAVVSRVPHVALEHSGAGLHLALHRRLLVRLVAGGFDLAITVSDTQRADLVRLGYPSSRIRTIPSGIPEPVPTRERRNTRAALGVPEEGLLALLVAMLRPEKQITRFVDAVAEARSRGCPVFGVVAGSGPELATIEARVAGRPGLSILGERADVPDLMAAADIVCLTSRAEALPMVVLEAMALGRPVLSTPVGGIPDAIGDAGVLVDDSTQAIATALCAAAADPARLRTLGTRARGRYVERFSMDRVAESYAEALRGVAAQNAARRRVP